MDLQQLRLNPVTARYPADHLYVFSGRGSVTALPNTVMGVGAFFFPPLSGRDFGMRYQLNLPEFEAAVGDSGRREHYAPPQVMLQDIEWLPWCIRRRGTYHRRLNGKLVSLDVQSELIAPADADGIIMRLKLKLRSPAKLRVDIRAIIENPGSAFGTVPPAAWNYEPPAARHQVWSESAYKWVVDDCRMLLVGDDSLKEDGRGWTVNLTSGRARTLHLGMTFQGPGLTPFIDTIESHAASGEAYWRTQHENLRRKFGPAIDRMPEAHQRLFQRGWATAMTCRWNRENFIAQPYYAAEGIDGGSICSYLWDLAYTSDFIAQLEGRKLRKLIEHMVNPEAIFEGYALSPTAPLWMGVFYAFSPFALMKIVADYVDRTGDTALLTRKVRGQRVIDALEQILDHFDERYRASSGVLDFGHNRHLIELHTAGYEGLVPNPNYEHAWSYRTLDRLRQAAKLRRRPSDVQRADALIKASHKLFWNEKEGWHFPAAQRDTAGVWSIQTLSALRLGVYPKEQVEKMVEHLRDGRFLGPHGVYSIARDDREHFTLNDVDWGGGGCFTGHVAILLEGLAHYGMTDAAKRVLDRITWWGETLPYIPQQTRADAPVPDGRPNAVAGAAICQALLALHGPTAKR